MRQTVVQAGDERADGLRLVAGGLERGAERKGLVGLHGSLAGRENFQYYPTPRLTFVFKPYSVQEPP
jgi:hypothetical protein